MRKVFLFLGCFAVAAGAEIAAPVQAAQVTSNLGVTITITNECTAGSTSPVAFGSHGVLSANIDATGTISVTCTTSAPYKIGLGLGNGSGASVWAELRLV